MESNEISLHEARVYSVLKSAKEQWMTAKDAAQKARVAPRTARAHVSKLTKLGLLDVAEVFPGHRYRLSDKASKRNQAYLQRLDNAIEVFGEAL